MKKNKKIYIIDGYNALNQIIRNGFSPVYEKRKKFVEFLEKEFSNKEIMLIFDGHPNLEEKIYNYSINVRFSRDDSADNLILRIAKDSKNKEKIIVITDDIDLGNSLKRNCEITVKKVDEFFRGCYNKEEKDFKHAEKPHFFSVKGKRITKHLYKYLTDKKGDIGER